LYHCAGMKQDGSIVVWGCNDYGQCNVPSPNSDFLAVATGQEHSMGLKEDSSIIAWGRNNYGQLNVPSPNTHFVAIAAGMQHNLGIKNTIVSIDEEEYSGPHPTNLSISRVFPNPTNSTASIVFQSARSADMTLEVYNTTGRTVRIRSLGVIAPGQHCVVWDGRDASGAKAASGVYFILLKASAGQSAVARVVLAR
jgi:hypothetical protein